MGKQISFIMDENDESKFFDFIKESGFVLLAEQNQEPKPIIDLPNKQAENRGFKLYLYKENFGEIIYAKTAKGRKYINSINAPVIEFRRTIIRPNSKEITRGRLWLEMKYYNDDGNLIIKSESINEWYKELSRWLKKNLRYIEIQSVNRISKEYISTSLISLVEKGYKILG